MWDFFRVLIPSWRFFDQTSAVPKLYARVTHRGQIGSSWLPVLAPPQLKWYSLFLNPEGNLYHANCNLLDHLLQSPEDAEARRILHRVVRHFLLQARGVERPASYEFQLKADDETILAGEGEL